MNQKPEDRRLRIEPSALSNARRLRREDVPAERKLWSRLRNRQLDGLKFRRQVPVGKYVADFLCHDLRLIIELDGHHMTSDRSMMRPVRDGWNRRVFV